MIVISFLVLILIIVCCMENLLFCTASERGGRRKERLPKQNKNTHTHTHTKSTIGKSELPKELSSILYRTDTFLALKAFVSEAQFSW